MKMPIGFKFTAVNAADGWGARYLDPLIAAGVAPVVMSIGAGGPVWEAQEKMKAAGWSREKRRSAGLVYRHADFDVPEYGLDPREAATRQWEYHRLKWPKELDRDVVWFGITNEPAFVLSPEDLEMVGPGPYRKLVTWNGGIYWDNSEWLAAHALRLAEHAAAEGVRLTLFGWSPGTPEPWQWAGPRMTELLKLLRANPDTLALDVHEYSLRADTLDAPALVGRWQAIPRPWPTLFVTEFGWTLNDAPETVDGVAQIVAAYGRLYARPEVRGLALWTLGKEGAAWGDLGRKMNGYLGPLAEAILTIDAPPLGGEPTPPPTPAPTPAPTPIPAPTPTAANLLVNAGWEEGHYHPSDANGYPIMALQVPTGWRINWRETKEGAWPNPLSEWPFLRPEMNRLPASKLAPDEQIDAPQALILEGGHTLKLFKGGGAMNATLITPVAAADAPRRLRLVVPVFADLVKGYTSKPQQAKVWANDPQQRDGLFRVRVGDRAVTSGRPEWAAITAGSTAGGWLALVPGQWNHVVVTFDAPAAAFDLKLDFILPFALPQNGVFLDRLELREIAAAPAPEPPPAPPPAPEPPLVPPVVDVSHHQGEIRWDVLATRIGGVVIRLGDGLGTDTQLRRNVAEARRLDVPFLTYHYWRPSLDPVQQAEKVAALVTELGAPRLVCADFEEPTGVGPDTAARARAYLDRLEALLGTPPIIYTSLNYWRNTLRAPAWGSRHRLWIAAWTSAARPIVPAPWTAWTLWQHEVRDIRADRAAWGVQSAALDINRFSGTAAEWRALCRRPAAVEPGPEVWRVATVEAPEWNPTFALHAAIVADGFSPIPGERGVMINGRHYRYMRALPPAAKTPLRVYWCEVPRYDQVFVWEDGRPVVDTPPPTIPPPAPPPQAGIDMSEYLWGDGRVHVLAYRINGQTGHQRLTTAQKGNRFYQVKDGEFEEFWADEAAIYRGVDTSYGNGKYYVQRRDSLTYGAPWCPRHWTVGQTYERNPLVSFYYKADCRKAAEPKEGYHRTWLKFAARHATWTSEGGVTLRDVVELHWLTAPGGAPAEVYFYARRTGSQPGGLVAWRSSSGNASWIVPGGEGQEPPAMEVIPCLKLG
jgi:GH25 family lysozyme M1 (1,4-beta-N-acetylmuramidase)